MGIFGDMINYIIDMGASAMLPLVIAILSIIVGVKIGKAVRAGLMVGSGIRRIEVRRFNEKGSGTADYR